MNANVIDAAEQFETLKSRQRFARLAAMSKRWREEIEADPWPYVDKVMERLEAAEEALRACNDTINPPIATWDDGPVEYVDPCATAFGQISQVHAIVSDWKDRESNG